MSRNEFLYIGPERVTFHLGKNVLKIVRSVAKERVKVYLKNQLYNTSDMIWIDRLIKKDIKQEGERNLYLSKPY